LELLIRSVLFTDNSAGWFAVMGVLSDWSFGVINTIYQMYRWEWNKKATTCREKFVLCRF
jgi:hypothetical protein